MLDRRYIIPVIAHRLIGWRTVRTRFPGVDPIPGDGPFPGSFGVSPPRLEPSLVATRRREPDPSQGTARGTAEIEALFTPDTALAYTAGITVQDYWAPADIGFELIAIADRPIDPSLANFLPREVIADLARRFNVPRALNLYLAKDIRGAWGIGYPVNPDEDDDEPGYAFLTDRYVEGEPIESEGRWLSDVITAAHELGHALGLIHRLGEDNLMYAYGTTHLTTRLEGSQPRIVEYYARRFSRSVYGPDSVPHLVAPRANEFPFF